MSGVRIGELKKAEDGFLEYTRYGLSLLSNLDHYYKTSTLEGKQKIIGLIFPEKLIFDNNNYRTKETNELLDLLCSKEWGLEGSKKKLTAKISSQSCKVAYGLDLSNFIDDFQGIKSLMNFQRGVMVL